MIINNDNNANNDNNKLYLALVVGVVFPNFATNP